MGWGGKTSSPGQPGTTPILPSAPISQAEPSATTMSSEPCVHRIGGLGSRSTMPDQVQYFGESALGMPRGPGAQARPVPDGGEAAGEAAPPVTGLGRSRSSK